ncbi:DUF5706 domain-containing protein [Glycomyces sp. TRM65418]|uniref:Pycsar system effector family protein n=1 Tax=Glycomyces sp. TRM65418 TaxID=2867006 RepID=UPI001CE53222|nr:Pycsar system effector family protein [Glycomyces sp. TRM65418]MCC3765267.1 DUF5706 domain-containing protein [Glycomyces sp. TRM65418]QZD54888.1 hypothetical protein K3N28_19500 [Glycomyces sp. TRM65418]
MTDSDAEHGSTAVPPEPDQAWKILLLVNDWVRHAETKLAATLAAAGISGGVLFNLVTDQHETSLAFNLAAVICCTAVILAGVSAIVGLYPVLAVRRRGPDDTASLIYFHDIEHRYRNDYPAFRTALHTLTTDADLLTDHLSRQIHANAAVADRKFRWANLAIRTLLIDLLALGALTLIIALGL